MPTVSYTHVREHFAEVLDEVVSSQEPMIITRRNRPDVALIPADDLASLRETAHFLRSPTNAARLLAALERSLRGDGEPTTTADLAVKLDNTSAV